MIKPILRIDRTTPHQFGHLESPMPVALVCRSGTGYSFLAVTSGYAARAVKGAVDKDDNPFGAIWHPAEDGREQPIRGADDLIALVWCHPDALIVPQGLNDVQVGSPLGLESAQVFYEFAGERRDAIIESLGVTMTLPDVHAPSTANRYRGLLLARRTGSTAFGQPGHGGSLVMAESNGTRQLVGILIASDGDRAVIAPLAPIFRRFDLAVVSDEEAAQNNADMDWVGLKGDLELQAELEQIYLAYREASDELKRSEAMLEKANIGTFSAALRAKRAKERALNAQVQDLLVEIDA